MKNNNPYWFMLIILLFIGIPNILFSQSKGDIEKSGTFRKAKADIFVAAWYTKDYQNFQPAYYKNGELNILGNGARGHANRMKIVNGDIYVSGDLNDKPVYWKNGQMIQLPCNDSYASGEDIDVVGNDVYVVGSGLGKDRDSYPRYWKNGQEILLPRAVSEGKEYGTIALSITVVDNDIYIIGRSSLMPIYWKNGRRVETISNDLQRVVTINKLKNDVYITGAQNKRAAYWKNGKTTLLSNEESIATAIAVEGNDVYAAGVIGSYEGNNMFMTNGSFGVGYYWKNGQRFELRGSESPYPFSIAVADGDVYVVGMDQSRSWYIVWKNGDPLIKEFVYPQSVTSVSSGTSSGRNATKTGEVKREAVKTERAEIAKQPKNHTADVPQILEPKNYAVLEQYPRNTKIAWTPVPQATEYEVIVEFGSGPGRNHRSFNETINFYPSVNLKTQSNTISFVGDGAGVHRYKIQARNKTKIISTTDWFYLNYLK